MTPELDYITIKGFKSLASVEKLKLTPINVVIGPNGAGKSNLIEVFSFLHSIGEGHLQDYVGKAGGAEKLLHFGSKVTGRIEIHLSFSEETNQYRLILEPTADDGLYRTLEARRVQPAGLPLPFAGEISVSLSQHLPNGAYDSPVF
ncbi:MAG: AAA family ATPase [Syntrophobacteraceae bacterium]